MHMDQMGSCTIGWSTGRHIVVVVERSRLQLRTRRRVFSFVSVGSDLANLLITWAGSLVTMLQSVSNNNGLRLYLSHMDQLSPAMSA